MEMDTARQLTANLPARNRLTYLTGRCSRLTTGPGYYVVQLHLRHIMQLYISWFPSPLRDGALGGKFVQRFGTNIALG